MDFLSLLPRPNDKKKNKKNMPLKSLIAKIYIIALLSPIGMLK
jgi:hypothetical protein